jgi:hypothetical protein
METQSALGARCARRPGQSISFRTRSMTARSVTTSRSRRITSHRGMCSKQSSISHRATQFSPSSRASARHATASRTPSPRRYAKLRGSSSGSITTSSSARSARSTMRSRSEGTASRRTPPPDFAISTRTTGCGSNVPPASVCASLLTCRAAAASNRSTSDPPSPSARAESRTAFQASSSRCSVNARSNISPTANLPTRSNTLLYALDVGRSFATTFNKDWQQSGQMFLCPRCRAGLCNATVVKDLKAELAFLCPRCRAGLCN